MNKVQDNDGPHGAMVGKAGPGRAIDTTRWLHYAAAPTFMVMALFTVALGHDATAMLCSAPGGVQTMHGMVLMYLLMALFHAGPWVTLASRHPGIDHGLATREQDNAAH